jgi:SPP1 family predicted phage head-tail adaptor
MISKYTRTGDKRKRLTFLSGADTGTDSLNSPVQTWTPYYTCWGAVEVSREQMQYAPSEFVAESVYFISIRYPGGRITIAPQDRIICEGITYVIQAIADIEQCHRELKIIAYVLDEVA